MSDTLRTRIAAVLKADIQEQAYTLTLLETEEPYSVLIDGTVDLLEVADALIAELGRFYEDSLQSTVFSAIRMVEQRQTPRHFTEEAE